MRKTTFRPTPRAVDQARAALPIAAVLLAVFLTACTSAVPTVSSMPKEIGGLPEGTPARPASQLAYPAVHDMPPPRTKAVLTPDELKQAESDLTAAADRQPKPRKTKADDQK
jgi:hypothetical protein